MILLRYRVAPLRVHKVSILYFYLYASIASLNRHDILLELVTHRLDLFDIPELACAPAPSISEPPGVAGRVIFWLYLECQKDLESQIE